MNDTLPPITLTADHLETLARFYGADIELAPPSGGWSTTVVAGRTYRAWTEPVEVTS